MRRKKWRNLFLWRINKYESHTNYVSEESTRNLGLCLFCQYRNGIRRLKRVNTGTREWDRKFSVRHSLICKCSFRGPAVKHSSLKERELHVVVLRMNVSSVLEIVYASTVSEIRSDHIKDGLRKGGNCPYWEEKTRAFISLRIAGYNINRRYHLCL